VREGFGAVPERAYRDRDPSALMDAESMLRVADRLEQAGIDVWLDGGWGLGTKDYRELYLLRKHFGVELLEYVVAVEGT
jgi:hypothetical protein